MHIPLVERAARFSWPAIEEQVMSYGVLRFAHGFTRRANSLTLYGSLPPDHAELVADCEIFFYSRSQPVSVRVPCLPGMSRLDSFLETNGYAVESPSRVMVRPLTGSRTVSPILRLSDKEAWLDIYYRISGQPTDQKAYHQKLIDRIGSETFFAVLYKESGAPACCALAIHYQGAIGIHNVATAPSCRRQHYASSLLESVLAWGADTGADYAYLQVEEANLPAVSLYEKLNFNTLYHYLYRVKEVSKHYERRDL